jgi:Ricin-type beta-trefoil lectin domain/Lysozyme like domain
MFRKRLSWIVKIAAAVAATGIAIAVPAYASGASASHSAGSRPTGAAVVRLGSAASEPVLLAPLTGISPRTAAQAATASSTCVRYATGAGWANNGYFAGDLVTAAAICAAESSGDPKLFVCDNAKGQIIGHGDFPPVTCPAGTVSYDRGLWQLNSVAASGTSDSCAFNPVCNAGVAYLASGRGTSFAPWSSYDQDVYTPQIDPAQAAVTQLSSGTVTSALLGECLVRPAQAAGAKVVIANCGNGAASQQWTISGGKLQSGSLCATISSTSAASPGIVLRQCASQKIQQWAVIGRFELQNKGDGKCLTDPGGSLTAGTQVTATSCANAKDQTWWLP